MFSFFKAARARRKKKGEFSPGDYWEKRLKSRWGLHGVGDFSLGRYYNTWLYRVRKEVLLRQIRRLRIDWKNASVLDIGSGTGFYVDIWRRLGAGSITGSDIAGVAVQKLRAEFPECSWHELDIGQTPVPGELRGRQYDLISAFNVLFHIVDDERYEKAFENVFALLRPGGLFVFSDVFVRGHKVRYGHLVWRSKGEIEGVMDRLNLRVLRRAPEFVLMNRPVATNNAILHMAWNFASQPVKIFNALGFIVGGALYYPELFLTSRLRRGLSSEIVICEKPKDASAKTPPGRTSG